MLDFLLFPADLIFVSILPKPISFPVSPNGDRY
jgi:hypothetical protein